MTYAGEGKIILTTEVKLKLHGKLLKLSATEEDLNNGSGFSFPIPPKWREFTGTLTLSHSDHFALNYRCRVAKLSSPDILKIISNTKVCPSCTHVHDPNFKCAN